MRLRPLDAAPARAPVPWAAAAGYRPRWMRISSITDRSGMAATIFRLTISGHP
jgi:hypothetical protein